MALLDPLSFLRSRVEEGRHLFLLEGAVRYLEEVVSWVEDHTIVHLGVVDDEVRGVSLAPQDLLAFAQSLSFDPSRDRLTITTPRLDAESFAALAEVTMLLGDRVQVIAGVDEVLGMLAENLWSLMESSPVDGKAVAGGGGWPFWNVLAACADGSFPSRLGAVEDPDGTAVLWSSAPVSTHRLVEVFEREGLREQVVAEVLEPYRVAQGLYHLPPSDGSWLPHAVRVVETPSVIHPLLAPVMSALLAGIIASYDQAFEVASQVVENLDTQQAEVFLTLIPQVRDVERALVAARLVTR